MKKTNSQKLIEYVNTLPDVCTPFFLETANAMATSTKCAYAKELILFFEHLIYVNPDFCDYDSIKRFTVDDLKKIKSEDISRYITLYMGDQKRENGGHAVRTCARRRAALSSFFNYLVNNRKVEYNPVLASAKIKIEQSDDVIHLDFEEQNTFIDAVEYGDKLTKRQKTYHERYALRDKALILLLLDTGMRVSELAGLDIKDIDFDRCSAFVLRKGGKMQHLYFSDEVRDDLIEYIDSRKIKEEEKMDSPLFVTLKGDRLSVRAIEVLVKKYATTALPGKDKITPHKMRSSFAMGFYEETKDILALQRKLGHKNLSATNIYAKATDKRMQETRSIVSAGRERIKQMPADSEHSYQ